jgi:hypothetical protein
MNTFLSIDVDFWVDANTLRHQLHLLMGRKNKDIPIIAVMNHQQMLRAVNESNARRLINIDEHSDLAECTVEELNCGTWVSYVKWRLEGTYIWIRNSGDFHSRCNSVRFDSWDEGSDWKKLESRYLKENNLKLTTYLPDCVGIGLCISPAFARADIADVFTEIVAEYGIPYRKGIRNERQTRIMRPYGMPPKDRQSITSVQFTESRKPFTGSGSVVITIVGQNGQLEYL